MAILIVGGTSGLGLELAKDFAELGEEVIVTGRHDPVIDFAQFREFDLSESKLPLRISTFVQSLPDIQTLVYLPGFYQKGHITDLSDEEIDEMIDVCGRGLLFFVKKLLEKQNGLNELISITSTSERVPRELEPVYNFAKAGAGLFTHAVSFDPQIGKTMKVLLSGMDSPFWVKDGRDTMQMLKSDWVAQQIMAQRVKVKKYRPVDILGPLDKRRVEIDETQVR